MKNKYVKISGVYRECLICKSGEVDSGWVKNSRWDMAGFEIKVKKHKYYICKKCGGVK